MTGVACQGDGTTSLPRPRWSHHDGKRQLACGWPYRRPRRDAVPATEPPVCAAALGGRHRRRAAIRIPGAGLPRQDNPVKACRPRPMEDADDRRDVPFRKADRPPRTAGLGPDRRGNRGEATAGGRGCELPARNCDTRFRSAHPLPYCKSQANTVRAFRPAFATT